MVWVKGGTRRIPAVYMIRSTTMMWSGVAQPQITIERHRLSQLPCLSVCPAEPAIPFLGVLRHYQHQSCCLDHSRPLFLRHPLSHQLATDQAPRYATRRAMTALQHLYPKYRAHAASSLHRRRYSPQSFVYTVLLFSALGLAGYFYPSGSNLHSQHSYTSLNPRNVGIFASTDEEVRCDLSELVAHISDHPHSVDLSTRPPINVAT